MEDVRSTRGTGTLATSSGKIGKLLNSSDKSNQKKYCETAPANEIIPINGIIALTYIAYLRIKININRKTKITVIDSDTTENFITKKYTRNKKHLIKDK